MVELVSNFAKLVNFELKLNGLRSVQDCDEMLASTESVKRVKKTTKLLFRKKNLHILVPPQSNHTCSVKKAK